MGLRVNVEITLSWGEAHVAALVGVQRRLRALANGRQHRWGGNSANAWTVHIESAAAELAVARFCDRFWWASLAPSYNGDVSRDEVRHSMRRDARLIVHRDDPDEARFWLVVGEIPRFTIVGHIQGVEAKREEWWCDPGTGRAAFFVPQAQLVMETR